MKRIIAITALALLAGAPAAHAASKPLRAPSLASPDDGEAVARMPAFKWNSVKGAATYEIEISAGDNFGSVLPSGDITTANTAATLTKTVADGNFVWRVRGVTAGGRAGRWSNVRSLVKNWRDRPDLQAPTGGVEVLYPAQPLVLNWSRVPGAFKYVVNIATDPSMAQSVLGTAPVETSGTQFAVPGALAPGRYHWTVVPKDAAGHSGESSAVGTFVTGWPSTTVGQVTDLNAEERVYDPEMSWAPVPGAVSYDVEVNYSDDFAVGSKVCCTDRSVATTVSPTTLLQNNVYYWRVRAVDVNGNTGPWSRGPDFHKTFDDVAPPLDFVPNLRIRDNLTSPASDVNEADAVLDVRYPIVAWDHVPGASGYEVQVTPHAPDTGCVWSNRIIDSFTANTSWSWNFYAYPPPGPTTWPLILGDSPLAFPQAGTSYCVRVLAIAGFGVNPNPITDVLSQWTQLGGVGAGNAAFRLAAEPPTDAGAPQMTAGDYRLPGPAEERTSTPLYTWRDLPNASAYWIVIARDANFTNVVEVAYTIWPRHSPRKTLTDETTSYYWAVIPVDKNGDEHGDALSNSPQSFQKRSVPPGLVAPAEAEEVVGHPVFRWTAATGAQDYRIQAATEPSFGTTLLDLTTSATSYTPTKTLPADTVIYWRVRAVDGSNVNLTWSPTRTFRRRLALPALGQNPTDGQTIPVLQWSPVQGAASYDIHVEQADGTKKDFNTKGIAFTPTTFYGTGVWNWKVRAVFPPASPGPYTAMTPFTRFISAPSGARAERTKTRVLLSWDTRPEAKKYKVQVASNTSFRAPIDSVETDHTSWAPDLTKPGYKSGGKLYWRVATVDEGGNTGAWSSGTVSLTRRLAITVTPASLKKGLTSFVGVHIRDAGGKPVTRAKVKLAGALRRTKKAGKKSSVMFPVKPRRKGVVKVLVTRKGYKSAKARIRIK